MSKKPAAKPAASGVTGEPDPAIVLKQSTSAWSLTASSFGSTLNETTDVLRKLTEENTLLKKQLAASETKSAATYAHTSNRLEQQIKATAIAETKITELTNRLTRVPLEIKAATDATKLLMQTEIDELNRKLRDRESALERLADFRKERDDLITELRNTRDDLEKEQAAHQADIAALERRNIKDRDQVRQEMFETMREAKAKLLSQAAHALDGTTKRILAENEAIVGELAFQSAEAERVTKLNQRLQEENIHLKREVNISADEIRELFRRTHTLTSALRNTKKELSETKSALDIALRTIAEKTSLPHESTSSNNNKSLSNPSSPGAGSRSTSTSYRPSTVPASPGRDTTIIIPSLSSSSSSSSMYSNTTKTINLQTMTRSRNSTAPLLEKVRLPSGIKIAPVSTVTVTIPSLLSDTVNNRPTTVPTTPNKHRSTMPTYTPTVSDIPYSNNDIDNSSNNNAGTGETYDYFSVYNSNHPYDPVPSSSSSASSSSHSESTTDLLDTIHNLKSELMVTKTELITAKTDLDIALDALVVLDSQRLEMLSLADDVTAALLRVGAELRPIFAAGIFEQIQSEAQAITARANVSMQSIDAPTRKLFYSLIQELLNDNIIVTMHHIGSNGTSSSTMGGGSSSSNEQRHHTIMNALHNAERTVLARGTTNGNLDAIPTDLSTGDARLLCRLIFVLASRMRLYLSDIARALPEPLTIEELLTGTTTEKMDENNGTLLKPSATVSTLPSSSTVAVGQRLHQPLRAAVQRREMKNMYIMKNNGYNTNNKNKNSNHTRIGYGNEEDGKHAEEKETETITDTFNAKYNAYIHG